jgi:hypothetical protein
LNASAADVQASLIVASIADAAAAIG